MPYAYAPSSFAVLADLLTASFVAGIGLYHRRDKQRCRRATRQNVPRLLQAAEKDVRGNSRYPRDAWP
jgi:hypothetical protein